MIVPMQYVHALRPNLVYYSSNVFHSLFLDLSISAMDTNVSMY